jgi:hypothetical protein
VLVREPHGPLRVVVGPGGADRPGQLRRAANEADLTALVLDVQLERVQARKLQILLESPGHRGERLGDVDPAQLGRDGAPDQHGLHGVPVR